MNNYQNPNAKDGENNNKKNNSRKKDAKSSININVNMNRAEEAMRQLRSINQGGTPSDTMGSYTGTSYDGGEPEQDADDL